MLLITTRKFIQLTLISCLSLLTITSCNNNRVNLEKEKELIASTLDSFNIAAANADFDKYFGYFAEDAIFIGTDATENWNKKDFMIWTKPFFDRKKTWNFRSIERHIFFSESKQTAWFDELLDTQMKICRGSGVLSKTDSGWKLNQYVLSMTIPNDLVDSVVRIKAPLEEPMILQLLKK